jgi:hypothetical protein
VFSLYATLPECHLSNDFALIEGKKEGFRLVPGWRSDDLQNADPKRQEKKLAHFYVTMQSKDEYSPPISTLQIFLNYLMGRKCCSGVKAEHRTVSHARQHTTRP